MEVNIPSDVYDSVQDTLGSGVKVLIKRLLRLEVKNDRPDRLVVLSAHRLYVFSVKVPAKIEHSIPFLDIQSLESKQPKELVVVTETKRLVFSTQEEDQSDVDKLIFHVIFSLRAVFKSGPQERVIPKMNVRPPDRLLPMMTQLSKIESNDMSPCGGFTPMYAAMCDYHGLRYMEDVAWDVDTIYQSQECRQLHLGDFDHLSGKHLVPIIAALEHNTWFTRLNATNIKLTADAANEVVKVMKRNTTIEELLLSNIGVKWDFAQRLSQSLLANPTSVLTTIDLSANVLEDRGISHLCGPLGKLSRGLVSLNLSRTGLSAKGANKLAEALCANTVIGSTLKTLDLSDNNLRGEEIGKLHSFLSMTNNLTTLKLAGSECALDMLFGALQRGCCQHLVNLDLSRNPFTARKVKDMSVPQSVRKFFAAACSLHAVNLADSKLPPEALKQVLLGIGSNSVLEKVELNLSGNDFGSAGITALVECLPSIENIHSLDVSNNAFDAAIGQLLLACTYNTALKKLAIGRNFSNIRSKHLGQVLESVVALLEEERSGLQSLSLADSRLRTETTVVINALGGNGTLTELDISGNQMGDYGARMLAKALQLNTKLRTVYWDRNATSPQGFQDVANALEKNYTLKKMPTPTQDASAALRNNQEKTEQALEKIESLLQRNHSPCKFSGEQAYRLQQGFLLSGSHERVDQNVVQLQDLLSGLLQETLSGPAKEDSEKCQAFIRDAHRSKQVLPKLQDLVLKSQDAGNAVETKLKSLAQELQAVIEAQLKGNVTSMLNYTEAQCPTIMADPNMRLDLEEGSAERSALPKDFTTTVVDLVGIDVGNKVSELNVGVVSYLSDRLVDGLIESLEASRAIMGKHLRDQKLAEKKEREKEKKKKKKQKAASATLR